MGKKSDRKKRPRTQAEAENRTFEKPQQPVNFEDEHPKFCFRYIQPGFDPKSLSSTQQSALITQIQNLASLSWKDIAKAPRHGLGTEWIPAKNINVTVPPAFEDEDRFMFLRYSGKLPMGGMRVGDVYHVLWVAKDYKQPYKHS